MTGTTSTREGTIASQESLHADTGPRQWNVQVTVSSLTSSELLVVNDTRKRPRKDSPVYVIVSEVAGRSLGLLNLLLAGRIVATQRDFAAFVLLTSAIFLLLPVLQLGTPLVVVRLAGSALMDGREARAIAICRAASRMATVVAASVFLLACMPWTAVAMSAVLPIHVSPACAVLIGVWLGSEVLRGTVADTLRALHRYKAHAIAGRGGRSVAVLVALVVLNGTNIRVGFSTLATLQLAANLVCVLSMGAPLRAEFRRYSDGSSRWSGVAELLRPGSHLLAAVIATWFLNMGDLWVVAALTDPAHVANYGIAIRLAGLAAMPLALTYNAVAPVLASFGRDRNAETRFLQGTSAASGLLAVAAYVTTLAITAMGARAMLGAGYSMIVPLVALLGAGQMVNSATGHCSVVLALHGRERLLGRATIAVAIVAIPIELVIGSQLGPIGVAVVSGAATAAVNLIYFTLSRRRLGISLRPVFRDMWPAVRVMSVGRH